jgi:hypothetical protein
MQSLQEEGMKLVTFGVSTPVGQIQRIGAIHQNKIIELNMGYTRYLADKHGTSQSYELAAAMLPPDMQQCFHLTWLPSFEGEKKEKTKPS